MTILLQLYLMQLKNRRRTILNFKQNLILTIRNFVLNGGDLNNNPDLLSLYLALVILLGNSPFEDLGLILSEDGKAIIVG